MKSDRFLTPLLYLLLLGLVSSTYSPLAYEHHKSKVSFQSYTDEVVSHNLSQKRPYFLLFSAQWCHWCHLFSEHTLSREDVYTYLNTHFINVFIDADIHTVATVKYNVTGLPYVVFLKPDGSVHFKYAGTLYGDDFVEVIREIHANVIRGVSIPGQENTPVFYVAPDTLDLASLSAFNDLFLRGVRDNFDPLEFGIGRSEKSVLPRTFVYLLEHADNDNRAMVIDHLEKTLTRALASIYDPLEGGFFRYAETRDWKIPHYEKMADINAGTVLVLHKINEHSPSHPLVEAANQTTGYLKSTMFHSQAGAFRSFQQADTGYFLQDMDARNNLSAPKVSDTIFTDRLAGTLLYLIDILAYTRDTVLEQQVRNSVDFLANMVGREVSLKRYYDLPKLQWLGDSLLREHALIARVLQKASEGLSEPRYALLAKEVIQSAVKRFYDSGKRIFIDRNLVAEESVEYLMEMNSLLALAMMGLAEQGVWEDPGVVEGLITYFSGVDVVLAQRLWESTDWELLEAYVPYLEAINVYLATKSVEQE